MDKEDWQWLISTVIPIIIYILELLERKPKKEKSPHQNVTSAKDKGWVVRGATLTTSIITYLKKECNNNVGKVY